MQVTVENGEGLVRRMRVELSSEEIEQEVDKRLRDFARQARLPGFRPGKAPVRLLRQRYGESVRDEVFSETVQKTYPEAISQQELRPAGMPEIEPDIDQAAGRYAYVANFEVMPQVELVGLAGREIKRPVAEVTEADVDAMIERLREQRKTWSPVDRQAADGDRLTVDFQGTIDGEFFQGGSAEGTQIVLGEGRMIADFEAQLVGAAAGDERVVEVTFPEDYHVAELAGKPARFQVQVKEVAEVELPPLDADFMAAFDVEDGDMDKFRADIRGNMERELKQRIEAQVKEQVLDALVEANPMEVPQALVSEQIKGFKEQMQRNMGGGAGGFQLPDDIFADSARRRVVLALLAGEAVRRHEITADPERVRAAVEEMADTYDTPQEVIDYYYADPQRLQQIEAMVTEEMMVERLLEEATVVDEPSTFEAVTRSERD
ncbi:trigger factor [Thiohalocapsa marina]|uniref:Trigger factor n=1 Tax=Thiohalocapsa marina TaxID=424902 RepID=A0A5M8FJD9_9GAMM|nr:trigger factor [Thiohalocapsa marina]KAA6183301.1 trigger factor [Thiohalocapsa marina]